MERKSSAANIFSPQLIASLIFPLGGKNGLSQLRRLLNLISQKKFEFQKVEKNIRNVKNLRTLKV
jgi:hypothetical protein